jgi:hypothetical protein
MSDGCREQIPALQTLSERYSALNRWSPKHSATEDSVGLRQIVPEDPVGNPAPKWHSGRITMFNQITDSWQEHVCDIALCAGYSGGSLFSIELKENEDMHVRSPIVPKIERQRTAIKASLPSVSGPPKVSSRRVI